MDTTVVIEAWTSVITPLGFVAALTLQAVLIGIALIIGWEMGKYK